MKKQKPSASARITAAILSTIAIVLVIILLVIIITSSNSKNPSETTPTPPESIINSGTLGDWEIAVQKTSFESKIKNEFLTQFEPEEGSKFLVVNLKITNKGKTMSTFLPSVSFGNTISVKVTYNDYTFSPMLLLGYSKELHNSSLNPLETKEGIIAIPIPDTVISVGELTLEFSNGENNLTFKIDNSTNK